MQIEALAGLFSLCALAVFSFIVVILVSRYRYNKRIQRQQTMVRPVKPNNDNKL